MVTNAYIWRKVAQIGQFVTTYSKLVHKGNIMLYNKLCQILVWSTGFIVLWRIVCNQPAV